MNKTKKKYCVHVYETYQDYEIEATSPEQAQELAMQAGGYDWEQIDHIEVMVTCEECGTDNDTAEKECDQCGAKL